jgi:exopolyphosphatase / guanosine-5'-triphosphate,3'-diphosphate pyrophosphatase
VPSLVQELSPDKPSLSKIIVSAIDIGTNSVHMVIVEVNPSIPSFRALASEKQMVRLGEYCKATGWLTPEAMQRTLDALKRFQQLSESFGSKTVLAVATSAVREAPNGIDFLHQIKRTLGIQVDLISGQEEARRIYLGVLSAISFEGQPHIVMDIGGGSTEFILGDGGEAKFLRSVKVGSVRLTDQFVHSDPLNNEDYEALKKHVNSTLEPMMERLLAEGPFKRMIGTSGTVISLAQLDSRRRNGNVPDTINGYELTQANVRQLLKELRSLNNQERRKLVPERRADVLVSGAIIVQEAMSLLKADSLIICERALREGLIVDWMIQNGYIEDRLRYQQSVRERSVYRLVNKFGVEREHTEHLAKLTLQLFDQTKELGLHAWGNYERQLLWAAAILHNIGHSIAHSSHHKHSYYLIRHGEMLGYTEEEIEILANLARYHRRSSPKRNHPDFMKLSKQHRQVVRDLSPLLRLASALDRRRNIVVKEVKLERAESSRALNLWIIPMLPDEDCLMELWSAEEKKTVFEEHFDQVIQVKLQGATD